MNPSPSPFSVPEPWELVAEGYAAEAGFLMRAFSLEAIQRVPLAADALVLDVAAGPGTLSLELASSVRRVDAVDFSPTMIASLEKRARSLGIENVQVAVADGQALPFPQNTYDAGFSLFGLMFFPDRPRGYAELLRVLKPGGVALVSSWAPLDESPLMSLMFGAVRAMDPEWPPPRRDPTSLENPEVLAAEMRDAGFVEVEVKPCTRSVAVSDAHDMWHRMTRSAVPLVLLRRRLGEKEWESRSRLGIEYLAGAFEGKPAELSTTAWLATGRKTA